MEKLRWGVLGLCLLFATSAKATNPAYTYTTLLDTSGPYREFMGLAMSSNGYIATVARMRDSPSHVTLLAIRDSSVTAIVDSTDPRFPSIHPWVHINATATVAFFVLPDMTGYTGQDSSSLVQVPDGFPGGINDAGDVLLRGVHGVIKCSVYGGNCIVVSTVDDGYFSQYAYASMNQNGDVAFVAIQVADGRLGIFRINSAVTEITTIWMQTAPAETFSWEPLAINNLGDVLFARDRPGISEVVYGNGTSPPTVAASGPCCSSERGEVVPIAINDARQVLYTRASRFPTLPTLYLGSQSIAAEYEYYAALNNAGQIAFIAPLPTDGHKIVRADLR